MAGRLIEAGEPLPDVFLIAARQLDDACADGDLRYIRELRHDAPETATRDGEFWLGLLNCLFR